MEFIKHYLVVAGIFVAIDAVWLPVVAGKFYKKELGDLLLKKAKLGPAVVFYALYVFGMVVFALNPALGLAESIETFAFSDALMYVIGHSALLGLLMYATYDLTNLSTLKNWSSKVTVVDLIWGTFVTTVSTTAAFPILK
jgi:uncharacterized membrane protein